MSAWTIKLDNLLEEIKYAAHAGDHAKAQALTGELQSMLVAPTEESHHE
jgi:hypothetical protein